MNNTETLHKLFEASVKEFPQNTAIIFKKQSLTYEALNQKANQLAHHLLDMGLTAETPVALCMERSIELLIAIFGVLKAGGAYIPLDPNSPEERMQIILNDSAAPFLITTERYKDYFASYPGQRLLLNNKQIETKKTHNPHSTVSSRNLAYVIYTSGSTGKPKGVLVEHLGLVDYSKWCASFCDFQVNQRIDFSSSHAFDFAVTTSLTALVSGLTVVICEDIIKKDPRRYLDYLNEKKINFIKLTPSYFNVLLYEIKNNPRDLEHLQNIMLAGESLSRADCVSWLNNYPQHVLFNEYGPTETSVGVSLFKMDSKTIHTLGDNVPVGYIADHISYYIIDSNQPVAQGEIGELYLGGSCVARGYLNNPALTREYFINDNFGPDKNIRLYKTGDLSRQLPGGEIECIGRIDHQIKIRGFRVEPGEIEHCLTKHPAVQAAAVTFVPFPKQKNKKLVAYYILHDEHSSLSDLDLRHHLTDKLPDYMIPEAFVCMQSFPLNANEKLDRAALPAPQFSISQDYLPPSSSLEKKLAAFWSEELNRHPIGLKDNFFELGGHSLSAAKIISRINHELAKDISLASFYQAPNIAALSALIEKSKSVEKESQVSETMLHNTSTALPLSDFQLMLWLADIFEPKAKRLNVFTRKRLMGSVDIQRLTRAVEALVQKHEVLAYRVSSYRPIQCLEQDIRFNIFEKNLASLSDKDSELILEQSVCELSDVYHWPKNEPQIKLRLFYLKNDVTELQLCLPHIISDDVSPEIVMSDLSRLYHDKDLKQPIKKDSSFRNYVLDEQNYIKKHLDRDVNFWRDYLKDASLLTVPRKYIIRNMQDRQIPYSTYIKIPEKHIQAFQSFCAEHHVSILDGLCAVLMMALDSCCNDDSKEPLSICLNRVKSTRDSLDYNNAIGCFLRIEPIKVALHKNASLALLSQTVHQAVMKTMAYQRCPNLVKLGSIGNFQQRKSKLKQFLMKWVFSCYSFIFRLPLNHKIIQQAAEINTIKENRFLININLQNSFLKKENKKNYFELPLKNFSSFSPDLLKIDNLLDVSFFRQGDSATAYMVISANLEPAFREHIAQEILGLMKSPYKKDAFLSCT